MTLIFLNGMEIICFIKMDGDGGNPIQNEVP